MLSIEYRGSKRLLTHLKAYCNKMAQVVNNEKLLVHFFQDSLSDATLVWYIKLNNTEIHGWEDLVGAFVKKYKFNMDIALDKSSLLMMEKGSKETV
jgi:hypothetical protein